MTDESSLEKYGRANQDRNWLVQALREHLLPVFIKQGFESAPLAHRGPIDRELVLSLPLGRMRRLRGAGVDLIEVQFPKPKLRRAAFRILTGVAPREGLMTFTGHWAAEDVYVGWLNEFYVMYASPRWQVSFFVWHWPHQSPTQDDFEKLAKRVAGFAPEVELALREGELGRHMRRFVTPRPAFTGDRGKEQEANA